MTFGRVIRAIPLPGVATPSGVAWDGRSLWVSDEANCMIMQLDPQSLRVIKQFNTPWGTIKSLQWVGRTLWYMMLRLYQMDPHTGRIIRDILPT